MFKRPIIGVLLRSGEKNAKSPNLGTYPFDITKRFLDIDLSDVLDAW